MSSRSKRFFGGRRKEQPRPDALKARNGSYVPVWSAEASDPVDYLASVIDQLRGSESVPRART